MPSQANLRIKELFPAAAQTATVNGTGVDLQGTINPGGRNMKAFVDVGAVSGTTPSMTLKMQDSPDNSVFTDIANAAFTAITANSGGPVELHFTTLKRYVRAVATISGTTPSFTMYAGLVVENRVQ